MDGVSGVEKHDRAHSSQLLLAEAAELAAPKESGAIIGWLMAALALIFALSYRGSRGRKTPSVRAGMDSPLCSYFQNLAQAGIPKA